MCIANNIQQTVVHDTTAGNEAKPPRVSQASVADVLLADRFIGQLLLLGCICLTGDSCVRVLCTHRLSLLLQLTTMKHEHLHMLRGQSRHN